MDGHRFDRVARALAAAASRRRIIASLFGGAVAGSVFRRNGEAVAQPIPCTTAPCSSGECCGGFCVDLDSDPANCGVCGGICPPERPACNGGACVCQIDCDPPEVPDPATCTCVCDLTCIAPFSPDPVACRCVCPLGTVDCGGTCVETCCDAANCGACGNVCQDGRCAAGVCEPSDTPTPAPPAPTAPSMDRLRQGIAAASAATLEGFPAPSEYENHPNADVRRFATRTRLLVEEGTQAIRWDDEQLAGFAIEIGWIGLTSGAIADAITTGEDGGSFAASGTECFDCAYERAKCLDQQCPGAEGEGWPCTCCVSCNLAELACLIRCVVR